MLTTSNLATFLQLREGFRKHAYDDAQPNVKLTAETEIKGTITVGYGTTHYPDGTPVEWDDKVTKSEALDYLQNYIENTIEPALENMIHRRLAGCQYDAIGSCIYQYGESEVTGWNLIRLINSDASWEEIALEWINGTVMWHGEPLFWGRRVSELFMFFDLDWMAGGNVPVLSDVIAAIKLMGFDGNMPKPAPIVHEDLFEPVPELPPVGTDPTPETPWTMRDREYDNVRAGGYTGTFADFNAHRTVVSRRNAIEAPNIDTSKPPKPMEDSETHRGLSKADSGKEGLQVGTALTTAAGTMATIRELTRDTAATAESAAPVVGGFTMGHFIIIGLAIGLPLIGFGVWRMYRGYRIAQKGRLGSQLKV